jgi:hypothetical protein
MNCSLDLNGDKDKFMENEKGKERNKFYNLRLRKMNK